MVIDHTELAEFEKHWLYCIRRHGVTPFYFESSKGNVFGSTSCWYLAGILNLCSI